MAHWLYTVTTTREGTDLVVEHMQEMDGRGWELLNGSTTYGPDRIAYTMWWRKPAPAPTPARLPVPAEATPLPGQVPSVPRPQG
jgi:hypothetical protein